MNKKDLLTNEEFFPKRANQKFANPINRIKYHNGKARSLRREASFINTPLINNLKILNKVMLGKMELIFHKEFLKGMGYTFEICTHVKVHDNQNRFCCYQYIILNGANETVKIIRSKND
jgi:hypothetical protein